MPAAIEIIRGSSFIKGFNWTHTDFISLGLTANKIVSKYVILESLKLLIILVFL